jgi:hypothetical protein
MRGQNVTLKLHEDAISLDSEVDGKVSFLPFVGIGPRRYFDLFSMALGPGYPIKRKQSGESIEWNAERSQLRVPLLANSYLEREVLASIEIENSIQGD